jgi:hypothetical protein
LDTNQNSSDIERLDQNQQIILNRLNSNAASSGIVSPSESYAKKRKTGGDRAHYYLIRTADLKTKHLWCVPGGVFGLYADGVGPLRPVGRCGIVVFSKCPDIVEVHPDPDHPDLYVLAVMVC